MSNSGEDENRNVVAGEITARVNIKIIREEVPDARSYRCCICHKIKQGNCTVYNVEINGDKLEPFFKACPVHVSNLEERIVVLVEVLERDLEGFLEREAEDFFGDYY